MMNLGKSWEMKIEIFIFIRSGGGCLDTFSPLSVRFTPLINQDCIAFAGKISPDENPRRVCCRSLIPGLYRSYK